MEIFRRRLSFSTENLDRRKIKSELITCVTLNYARKAHTYREKFDILSVRFNKKLIKHKTIKPLDPTRSMDFSKFKIYRLFLCFYFVNRCIEVSILSCRVR